MTTAAGFTGEDPASPAPADAASDSAPSSSIATLFRTAQVLLLSLSLAHVCLGVLAWRSLLGGAGSQGENSGSKGSGGSRGGALTCDDDSSGGSSIHPSNTTSLTSRMACSTVTGESTLRASAASMLPTGSSHCRCLPIRRRDAPSRWPRPASLPASVSWCGTPPAAVPLPAPQPATMSWPTIPGPSLRVTPSLSAAALTLTESPPPVAGGEEPHGQTEGDKSSSSKAVDTSFSGWGSVIITADESINWPDRGGPDHATLEAIVEEGVAKHGGSKNVAAAFEDLKVHLEGLLQADYASGSNTLFAALSLFFDRWTPARGELKEMSSEEWKK